MKKIKIFFIGLFLIQINQIYAQVCNGPRSSTVEVNEANGGTPTWATLVNAVSSNDVRDVTSNLSSIGFSQRLKLTGFGFSIPTNTTITGVIVNVERSVSGGSVIGDNEIMLVKGGVTQTATNKAVTGVAWPTTDAVATYGTSTDMWSNTWTAAEINAADFGVAISAARFSNPGAPQTARIDFVSITVCYTVLLPVQWLNVSGNIVRGKHAEINFKVNELAVEKYVVEKSIDGRTFTEVSTIISKGDGTNEYSFIDIALLDAINFFRIKQVDFNGNYNYSSIIKLANKSTVNFEIYPNPVKNIVTISGATVGSVVILTDVNGKVIKQINVANTVFTIDVSKVVSGVYLLKSNNGTAQKIIKE